jgi:hypothetical protein
MLEWINKDESVVVPKELLDVFNQLTLKHATVPTKLLVKYKPFSREGTGQYTFWDPRFVGENDKPVGRITWEYNYQPRTDTSYNYVVFSPRIQNQKYGAWNKDYHTISSINAKKAIKAAMEFIKPFSYVEIVEESQPKVERAHDVWVSENSRVAYNFNLNHEQTYAEIKNLASQGVVFATEAFKKAVAKLAEYEEWQERRKVIGLVCIYVEEDKCVEVRGAKETIFKSIEELTSDVQSKMAMLKIMDLNILLPEVGYRVDEKTFWVYG